MTLTDEITSGARESGQETPQKRQEVRCGWCKRRFAPRRATQQYCHPSHRLAACKYRNDPEHAPPPPPPPRSTASGLQVSWARAVRRLADHLVGHCDPLLTDAEALDWAAAILAPALSDRQRAMLDNRKARNGDTA